MHIRICAFFLMVGLLSLGAPIAPIAPLAPIAVAAPFTAEQCSGLRQLRHELETRGVGTTVAKGAKWAAQNLNAEQLSEVGAFLKLGEEIRFRCGKSTVGKKKQSALNVNIPLPVRNSRRLQQEKADKAEKAESAKDSATKTSEEMSPEAKSVISAVTGEKKESAKEDADESSSKSSKK